MPIGSETLKEFYIRYKTTSDLRGAKDTKRELKDVGTVSKRTGRDFRQLRQTMLRASRAFVTMGVAIGGTALAFGNLASKADVFRQQMVGLVGLAPKTATAFSKAATRIAATYGRTLEEVGRAFYATTSAGYRGQQAEGIVTGAARGAAAGLGTVDEVTKLLTLSLSVFKDDGLEAADALDKLAAGARQANFDGNALGAALPQLGLFAKGLGIDFGETTGLLAAMSKQIANAGEASTALQSLFRGLSAPSEQGRKALAGLGIEVQDLHDRIAEDGLLAGIQLLDGALKASVGTGAAYAAELQKILARVESQTAFKALIGDLETANKIIGEVTGSTGTLDEALGPVLQGTSELFNQFKLIGAELGEVLLPQIDALSRGLGRIAETMNENQPTIRSFWSTLLNPWGSRGFTNFRLDKHLPSSHGGRFSKDARDAFRQAQLDELAEENRRQAAASAALAQGGTLVLGGTPIIPAAAAAGGGGTARRRPVIIPGSAVGAAGVSRFSVAGASVPGLRSASSAMIENRRIRVMQMQEQVAQRLAYAGDRAVDSLLGFGDHLIRFFDAVGLRGVGSGIHTAVSTIDAVRSGIDAYDKTKETIKDIGKAGPVGIAIATAAVGIFAFLKIRSKRREKREQEQQRQQQRYHLETLRALNPYRSVRGQSLGNIGRYWSGGGFDDVYLGGGSTGPPGEGPGMASMGGGGTMVQAPVTITVNASPGMDEQMVAHQVQQKLTAVFRQTAADFG